MTNILPFHPITTDGEIDDSRLLGDMEATLESIFATTGPQGLTPMMHPPHITDNENQFLHQVHRALKGEEQQPEIVAVLFTLFSATAGDDHFASGGKIDRVLKAHHVDTKDWTL